MKTPAIDEKGYVPFVSKWLANLKDLDINYVKEHVGESYIAFKTNYPPFSGITIDVTELDGEPIVIFSFKGKLKGYYPKEVKISTISDDFKVMHTVVADNLFWVYGEAIHGMPFETQSFGLDMDMPFLAQQKFEILTIV